MLLDQVWQAIILGVLQGLTEFLPISSSAHLILLPWLLGWRPMGLTFDVVLHAGTLLAVLTYFRRDWRSVLQNLIPSRWSNKADRPRSQLPAALFIGTLPAIVVGSLFRYWIEDYLRSPWVTVFTLSGFGLLLWWADRAGSQERSLESLSARDGLLVGIGQALALMPGVSRSGITITVALGLGFSREDSARFSFLLAGPVIMLAATEGLYELGQGMGDSQDRVALIIGTFFAFVTGFFCIKYFLRFLQVRSFLPFVFYRLILAAVILVLLLD